MYICVYESPGHHTVNRTFGSMVSLFFNEVIVLIAFSFSLCSISMTLTHPSIYPISSPISYPFCNLHDVNMSNDILRTLNTSPTRDFCLQLCLLYTQHVTHHYILLSHGSLLMYECHWIYRHRSFSLNPIRMHTNFFQMWRVYDNLTICFSFLYCCNWNLWFKRKSDYCTTTTKRKESENN